MSIDPLNSGQELYPTGQTENVGKKYGDEFVPEMDKAGNKRADTLELSSEAMRLGAIQVKAIEGYYDKPEVLKDVAQKISKELPPEA